jgi:hypothetical protein
MAQRTGSDKSLERLVGTRVSVAVKATRPGVPADQIPNLVTVNPKVRRIFEVLQQALAVPRVIFTLVGAEADPFHRVEFITPMCEDLVRIPTWACVGFAARCAQAVLPHVLLPKAEESYENHFSAVEQAITFAADCAEKATIIELPPLTDIEVDQNRLDPAVIAAVCAALSPFGASDNDIRRMSALAGDYANWAGWYYNGGATHSESFSSASATNLGIWSDFGRLAEAAEAESWTHSTPVPRTFFQSERGPKRPVIFLCHAKDDSDRAKELYHRLRAHNMEPWLDKYNLKLGDEWEPEIRKAVRRADAVVICLTPRFDEIGFRQQEVRWALDAFRLRPPGRGFLIPYFFEPSPIPEWLEPFHAGEDLTKPTNFEQLLSAVKKHSRITT